VTRRRARVQGVALLVLCVSLPVAATTSARAAGDGGWTIASFDAQIEIQSDGRILVNEALDVDFGALEKHGIFRDVPVKYDWPSEKRKIRVYELQVLSVTDARGRPWHYETSTRDAFVEIKIGDADRTVTGKQAYRIAYAARRVLNAFSDRDELFWNVTGGDWAVPILRSSATVRAPEAPSQTACYVVFAGSTAKCGTAQCLPRTCRSRRRIVSASRRGNTSSPSTCRTPSCSAASTSGRRPSRAST